MSEMALALLDPPIVVNPGAIDSIGMFLQAIGLPLSGAASTTWPVANKAQFIPWLVSKSSLWLNAFTFNGTVVAGNLDIGIYNSNGRKLWSSGSIVHAGTSVVQVIPINAGAGFRLEPGLYFMALALSSITATIISRTAAGQILSAAGMCSMVSALPLPATAVFAAPDAIVPVFGFSQRSFL